MDIGKSLPDHPLIRLECQLRDSSRLGCILREMQNVVLAVLIGEPLIVVNAGIAWETKSLRLSDADHDASISQLGVAPDDDLKYIAFCGTSID